MRKLITVFLTVLVSSGFFIVNDLTAGGATSYPNGAEDFMSGAVPPPGNYFLWYSFFYHSNSFKSDTGHDYTFGPLSDIRISSWANAYRFIHVTKLKILGANLGFHVFLPTVYADYDFGGEFNPLDDDKFGLADIIIDPFILSWHTPYFHWVFGVDIYIPTGRFDRETDMLNLTSKVWTFEPALAFTWLPGPFDVSCKFMYDFNSFNNDHIVNAYEGLNMNRPELISTESKLEPGQEFHFDYAVGYNITPSLTAGASGYFYKQVTSDRIDDHEVSHMKGRVFSIGPTLKVGHKNISVTIKGLWEMAAKNRPQGNSVWLKLLYIF